MINLAINWQKILTIKLLFLWQKFNLLVGFTINHLHLSIITDYKDNVIIFSKLPN